MKKGLLFLFVSCILLAVFFVWRGISVDPELGSRETKPPAYPLYGVSVSPESFEDTQFTVFLKKANEAGNTITWAGSSDELAGEDSPAAAVLTLSRLYGFTPVLLTDMNDIEALINFVAENSPPIVAVGIEINLYSKEEYETFVKGFGDMYQQVKTASPQTQIMTVFQYEQLAGYRGGLYGGENNPDTAQWAMLQQFPQADMIGFTTYPGIVFSDPSEIPDDYYAQITTRTHKPIAFVEIGWPSNVNISGWESSEEEQARFVTRFFALTSQVEQKISIWTFLNDLAIPVPFNTMGLLSADGNEKTAFISWKNNSKR